MMLTKLVLAAIVAARALSAQAPLAISGVTLVDPSVAASRQAGMTNQTVLIRNGIIEAVGPSVAVPRGARRVDGRGKFLIPGLWDAHVHFMNTGPSALPLYVAMGVTSVREMGGFIDSRRAWQSRMRAGTLVGPRILTPGPILEAPRYLDSVRQRSVHDPRLGQRVLPYHLTVSNAADARKAIDSLVKLHVDFVKVHMEESPESYFAILREARRVGLKVAGHVPSGVSVTTAVDSGQHDIEHALSPPLSQLAAEQRDSVYLEFAKWGTWYTPMLVVTRMEGLTGDSAKRADARQLYASSVADVRRMHELGVLLLAGTDAGSVLVDPGFALHEELRLLVEDAGLAPLEALWCATIGPARFAGLDATLGSIAPGKTADLVLLDANPLDNIRNTRRISAVIQGGRVFAPPDLDGLLKRARRARVASSGER